MKLYAIREVSEMTGIKPVTLRAWQRRYGLIQPQRTDTGHRLYSEENLERIRDIQSWLAKGVSIGKVKALLESGADEVFGQEPSELEETEALLLALASLNKGKAESVIAGVFREYPLNTVITQFAEPINRSLEKVKAPLRTLQKGLYQSLMISQLYRVLEAENKAASRGKALFISLDEPGSIPALFSAAELAGKGFYITQLDGVEDVSGLKGLQELEQYELLQLHANRSLQARVLENIHSLRSYLSVPLICSGLIEP